MSDENMELDVWSGDWGLPSVDYQCLTVMAYCKFSNVTIKFNKANNPWTSPNGELPVLRNKEETESSVSDILDYLRKKNWGTDFDLTTKESADIVAFTTMMEEKLLPGLLQLWWTDAKTFTELTRPWVANQLPFPLSYYIPLKKHKDVEWKLANMKGVENFTDTERETKIYREAKECLNNLSAKLGNKDFFFGTTPSSLDAIVFGYLAPLLRAPVPNTQLQNHLKACTNLCNLCNRILNQHFPLTSQEEEELRKKTEEERKKAAESADFPNRRRNMMVSGFVALTAMMGYAFMSGLVKIEFQDKENGNSIKPPPTANFAQFGNMMGDDQDDDEGGDENQN